MIFVKKWMDMFHIKILFLHIRKLINENELSLMILFIKRINGRYVKVRKLTISVYNFFLRRCKH
jgi:hypothetical protein